jgi:hypothetical protein
MAATLTELEWRRESAKMVVLIADAPPHGKSSSSVLGSLHRNLVLMECQVSARTEIVRDDACMDPSVIADDLQRSRREILMVSKRIVPMCAHDVS